MLTSTFTKTVLVQDVDAAQRSCDVLLDVGVVMELVGIFLIILTQTTWIRRYFVRMCWSHFKCFCVSNRQHYVFTLYCVCIISYKLPKSQKWQNTHIFV